MNNLILSNSDLNLLKEPRILTFEETKQVAGGCPPCVLVALKYLAGGIGFVGAAYIGGIAASAGADTWKSIVRRWESGRFFRAN